MTRPPCYIYKIPLSCLTGYIATDRCPVRKQSVTPLLAPVSGGIDKCVLPKRSPLVRSKAVHPQLSDDQVRIVTYQLLVRSILVKRIVAGSHQ